MSKKSLFLYVLVFSCVDIFSFNEPLYAPWRNDYYDKVAAQKDVSNEKPKQCPFCSEVASGNDERYFILKRGAYCFIQLNLFPYASGHMLVIPYEHKGHLKDFSAEARAELMEFANLTVIILQEAYGFSGANIGINLGRCAGASLPWHLHVHVVPRFDNDYPGFLPITARTPLLMIDLVKMYEKLRPLFNIAG